MPNKQRIALLGASGSIGASTLDVVARHPERFEVVALTAHSRLDVLAAACLDHRPAYAVTGTEQGAEALRRRLQAGGLGTQVLWGPAGLEAVARLPEVDTVMAAIVGAAGLASALAAARAGKRVLLANKEALVMAGQLFLDATRQGGALLLPVDSEHNAILQCLPEDFAGDLEAAGVRRLLLTASGGPLRTVPLERLAAVTPDQACAHPNWEMGRKISVDSATMMNKGLELIEASWLFGAPPAALEVVVHPQSVIHSMVEYRDGSVLAQMGNPDMRIPIAHVLGYPERIASGARALDFLALGSLSFEAPDIARFPCLRLARAALEAGGTAPAVLNAANEVAVEQFLAGALAYTGIAAVIETVLERVGHRPATGLDDVLQADAAARRAARDLAGVMA